MLPKVAASFYTLERGSVNRFNSFRNCALCRAHGGVIREGLARPSIAGGSNSHHFLRPAGQGGVAIAAGLCALDEKEIYLGTEGKPRKRVLQLNGFFPSFEEVEHAERETWVIRWREADETRGKKEEE